MTSSSILSRTEQKPCFICRNSEATSKWDSVEDLEYQSYKAVDYVQCSSCGLIWQHPLPAPQLIASFYPENYRNYRPVKKDLLVFLKNLQTAGFAKRITRHIKKNKNARILDIGFGNGQLLLALRNQGYSNLYGSDFNSRDCDYLSEKGIKVAFSNVEEKFPFEEQFDCIVMNNVIEHFLNPMKVMEYCLEHLTEDGCLILVTPNADAMELNFFGKYWAGFHAPRHTFLFNTGSLELLSKNLGFRNAHTEPFDDPGQWAISIQNKLQSTPTFRTNLKEGLASYAVPLSIVVLPFVIGQKLLGKSTALMCVLRK